LACDGSVSKKGAARSDAAVEYYSVNRDLLADVQHLLLRLGIQSRVQLKQGRYLGQIHYSWRLTITSQDDVARFARAIPIVGAKAQTLAAWNVQRRRFDETLLADPIVAVEPAGETACRCITVEEDHTFTADDLVVHNSALTTVRYPIYRMERNPGIRVMLGCYDQSLANLFSRQSRRIAQDRGFRGGEIRAQDEWETIGGGSFRAVGVGGGITGRGADLIIIDDPIRSREEANSERWRDRIFDWYTNDIYTRLEPGGAIILIQTRWHEDDLAGRILASPDGPNWTVIQLPAEAEADDPLGREEGAALCPERFDLPALYDIKSVMGLDYYALYQQRPMAQEGGLYKQAWFRYATAEELAELGFDYISQAWDTASSQLGDWSACVTAGVAGNEVIVLDVFKARLETPDLLRAVKDQAAKWGPRMILVEDAASGIAIQQMLRRETRLPVVPVPAFRGGKLSHAQTNTPYVEGGRVRFGPGAYLTEFEHELLSFPTGTHDDQVDAFNILLTRIFNVALKRATSTDGSGRPDRAPAPLPANATNGAQRPRRVRQL
ncbi:MAG TPA: LAGLIDADG family homing endonuclease, partial [Roseiflexaceae bacterium]